MTFIRRLSLTLVALAIAIACLNLCMNFMMNYSLPAMQLDLSADGDLFGFHEMEHEADGHFGRGSPPANGFGGNGHLSDANYPYMVQADPGRAKDDAESVGLAGPTAKSPGVTSGCMGLCAVHAVNQDQASFVSELVTKWIRKNKMKPQVLSSLSTNTNGDNDPYERIDDYTSAWALLATWGGERSLYPPAYNDWPRVIRAVASAGIRQATNPKAGIQVKAKLELVGGQIAYFKPMRYNRSHIITGPTPYEGADRHNGEIAAFHLARLLGFNRAPITVGRSVNLKQEIFRVADIDLLGAFFNHSTSGALCLYRKKDHCRYCNKNIAACADPKTNRIEGSMSLNIPESVVIHSRASPWIRSYHKHKQAPWETDHDYCASAVAAGKWSRFGVPPLFLDLIDTAVFDFLVSNADRHHIEFVWGSRPRLTKKFDDAKGPPTAMVLLLDNGKSFGDPNVDEMTILAPLYQCCQVRRRTYDVLRYYVDGINLAASLDNELINDPVYPVLTLPHLNAVNRRLLKAWAVVQVCLQEKGREQVVIDDGFR